MPSLKAKSRLRCIPALLKRRKRFIPLRRISFQIKSSMDLVKKFRSMIDNFLVHSPSVCPDKVILSKNNHPDDIRHQIFAGNWPEKQGENSTAAPWPLRYVLTSKLEELALFDQLVKERAEISANFAFLIFEIG